jgi:hypothetical protein
VHLRIGLALTGLLAVGLAAAACNDSSTRSLGGGGGTQTGTTAGGGGGGGGVVTDAAAARRSCDALLSAAIDAYVRCYGGTRELYTRLFDAPSLCGEFEQGVRDGKRAYYSASGTQCTTRLRGSSCDFFGDELEVCQLALGGLVAPGGACREDECGPGTFCQRSGDSCTGSCLNLAASGESCAVQRCASGLECVAEVCVAPAGLGDACEWSGQCARDLYCADQRCANRKSAGSPCGGGSECARGLSCAGPDGARACREPKKIGEACAAGHDECVIGYCTSSGRCQAPAEAGQPCGEVSGNVERVTCLGRCLTPDESREGRCVDPRPAGAACTADEECDSYDCVQGTCAAEGC